MSHVVIAGLDPAIHREKRALVIFVMDRRVKPGDDA
jgi:hypothetical protein